MVLCMYANKMIYIICVGGGGYRWEEVEGEVNSDIFSVSHFTLPDIIYVSYLHQTRYNMLLQVQAIEFRCVLLVHSYLEVLNT